MEFKERMKAARERVGLSQAELADAVQISQAAISRAESGISASCTRLAGIASVCGVSALWLSEGQGPMTADEGGSASAGNIQLRDYLAAQALQGILAAEGSGTPKEVAKMAYEYADAMLAARKK